MTDGGGPAPRVDGAARSSADESLLAAARTVMGASLRAADQIGGVSVVQLRALSVLRLAGESNLGQLSAQLGVTASTTSRLVDRLVAAGLVHRRPAPHTRREIALTLTRQGEALLDRYDDLRLEEMRRCLDLVPPGRHGDVTAALGLLREVALPRPAGPGGAGAEPGGA